MFSDMLQMNLQRNKEEHATILTYSSRNRVEQFKKPRYVWKKAFLMNICFKKMHWLRKSISGRMEGTVVEIPLLQNAVASAFNRMQVYASEGNSWSSVLLKQGTKKLLC